ncbi:SRPBCC family protein [Actinophytocola xanthii]|uniref:MxaD family protein n=1 Tax=Actinophytocola xanthii TaxID=1912961 RepID=A0A1Q8CLL0_9PSEU|nr:SRPBCC family protein [Actinophytocola xanthii]OLF15240.1 hypothetical protein BU204_22460 [Actinophytocola xanthii]
MGRYTIEKTAPSTAAPGQVYRLLRDGSTWPAWSRIDAVELEREGDGEREGVGAIRVLTSGRVRGRDRITGFEPDRQFRYVHLEGLPVRDYEARIDLAPVDGGTEITWHVTFDAKYPGTGWLVRRSLDGFIRDNVNGLAEYAPST